MSLPSICLVVPKTHIVDRCWLGSTPIQKRTQTFRAWTKIYLLATHRKTNGSFLVCGRSRSTGNWLQHQTQVGKFTSIRTSHLTLTLSAYEGGKPHFSAIIQKTSQSINQQLHEDHQHHTKRRQDESCERKSSSEKCNCGCLKERQLTARTKCFVDVGGTLKCAETKSALHDVFVFSVNCSTSPKESRMNVWL